MRTLILAHDRFHEGEAKTAEALIRYGDDEIVAVVDRASNTEHAADVVPGAGEGIDVVPRVEDALDRAPDRLVVGVAPVGGRLPEDWRPGIETALRAGVDLVAGLHDRLAANPGLADAAQEGGARIHDVRVPPDGKPIYSGRVLDLDATVVLTVGTDCSSGKMTTSVELVEALRDRGIPTAFAATGQTGLMLDPDAGVPIDAVASDFVAGWAERIVLEAREARDAEIVVVEGQGALSHPAYAAVSLGLLHGASPHACVLCHDAERERKGARFANGRRFPVLEPSGEWQLVHHLARAIREPRLAGLSVMNGPWTQPNTGPLGKAPVVDVLDGGAQRLADAVEALR